MKHRVVTRGARGAAGFTASWSEEDGRGATKAMGRARWSAQVRGWKGPLGAASAPGPQGTSPRAHARGQTLPPRPIRTPCISRPGPPHLHVGLDHVKGHGYERGRAACRRADGNVPQLRTGGGGREGG